MKCNLTYCFNDFFSNSPKTAYLTGFADISMRTITRNDVTSFLKTFLTFMNLDVKQGKLLKGVVLSPILN